MGFAVIAAAFLGLRLMLGATTMLVPFLLLLFGATYFFSGFGPNTATFVYPAEIFLIRVWATTHGIRGRRAGRGFHHRHLRPGCADVDDRLG